MASYGRNFHTRISPYPQQRRGRFTNGQGVAIPIGVPVIVADDTPTDSGLTDALPAALATGAQAPRLGGLSGIAIYEHIDINGPGLTSRDPFMTTFSDIDTIPDGELLQIISGGNIKVVFKNTVARQFLGLQSYTGRTMVAGMGATPTVAVGDYLTPGTGNDTAGYWAVTATAANAWLTVTNVDVARQEVEAELRF